MSRAPRVCVNRLPSGMSRVLEAYRTLGFDATGVSFVHIEPLDVAHHPAVVELDRYDAIVVTSPEAAARFVEAVADRWPQWPVGLRIWCVGPATADVFPPDAPPIEVADPPGSQSVLQRMQARGSIQHCVVATGAGSGRQFEALTEMPGCTLEYLDLYRVVPIDPFVSEEAMSCAYWVHGSAALLEAATAWATQHAPWWAERTHFVTSDRAEMLLLPGSRYYRVSTPAPEAVLQALQGEPRVKDSR